MAEAIACFGGRLRALASMQANWSPTHGKRFRCAT